MDSSQILEEIDQYIQKAMREGLGREGLTFPFDPHDLDNEGLRDACFRLAELFAMINESYHFSEQLSQGKLKAQVSKKNIFAMPLKSLQANLTHLSWQAKQVAEGDLNQQVHFLGEFSDSFNHMINSLREKQSIEQRFKLITEVIGEGIFLVDTHGRVVFANPEAYHMLGYLPDQLLGATVHETFFKQFPDGSLIDPDDNPLLGAINDGESYNEEGAFTCCSGKLLPVMISSRPIPEEDTVAGTVIAFRDITEQKNYLQSLETINTLLEKQATTDSLTGIYNRMKFNDVLEREIARAKRYESSLALIMFDIDYFKKINDTYGHGTGDKVLKRLAQLVMANIRDSDSFARWGGEEFTLCSPGITLFQGMQLAEKIRGSIEQYDFYNASRVTASFGVSLYRLGDTISTLTNRADDALYQAKEKGRNRVEVETAWLESSAPGISKFRT
jgi:diguanylate cyclase (GGDEF)-like protein/PAS domain S-box-containing protein